MTEAEIKKFVNEVNTALEQLDVLTCNLSCHAEYIAQIFENLVAAFNA